MIAKGITHRGMVRENNEDAFLIHIFEDKSAALLVVCDGMGGAKAGNIASTTAARAFTAETLRLLSMEMGPRLAMQLAADKANEMVFLRANDDPTLEGMGTTMVAAFVQAGHVIMVNVGDSRGYLVDELAATQITTDHSYVQELYRAGKLTAEQTRAHPNRNLITRAVGIEPQVNCDIFEFTLAPEAILLLCTDGLTGMLTDDEIFGLVDFSPNLEAASKLLVASACQRGGSDNVTALVFCQQDDVEQDDAIGGLL